MKLWRDQQNLDFPSFYLELTVIQALHGVLSSSLSQDIFRVLIYLRDKFVAARVVDPANTANIVSGDMTLAGKQAIKRAATFVLAKKWGDFVR